MSDKIHATAFAVSRTLFFAIGFLVAQAMPDELRRSVAAVVLVLLLGTLAGFVLVWISTRRTGERYRRESGAGPRELDFNAVQRAANRVKRG
jgi:uncharacterized membrane protein